MCVLGLTASEVSANQQQWPFWYRFSCHISSWYLLKQRRCLSFPNSWGPFSAHWDQGHGWCKQDRGSHVLHHFLGNQTTGRLGIKTQASSPDLILEPKWVLGWLGELWRPFQPLAHAVTLLLSCYLSVWCHAFTIASLLLPLHPASLHEEKGVLGTNAHFESVTLNSNSLLFKSCSSS